jgi:Spy/CpxP family protein refolding chaperone
MASQISSCNARDYPQHVSQIKKQRKNMKQMMMTLLAAVMVSTAAVAQDKDSNKPSEDNNRKQEMVKHRTDQIVKDYQLSDKQAKQLLELNTKYADKMRPRHPRHHGPHGMKGERPEPPKGEMKGERPEPPKGEMKGELPEPPKGDRMERRKEMEETMKAYEAELQKIMTPDQFTRYQADMKARRDKGPRHDRQPRQ